MTPDTSTGRTRCPLVRRRTFVAGLGATVTVAAAAGAGISLYRRSGAAGPVAAGPPVGSVPSVDRTLVVVELGGGNDTLSTVVPASGRYRDLRPTTAIEDPIEIDDEIGLHPELATVADLYRRGQVAIVEGVGAPDPDLSHFISMQRWWAGGRDGDAPTAPTGWLGRYLDAAVGYENPLAGIAVGPGPSPALLGAASFAVGISDAQGLSSGFPWWVDDVRDFTGIWQGFAPADVPLSELDPVRRAIASTAAAQGRLQAGLAPLATAMEREEVDLGSLEGQLALAASDLAPRIVYVHGNVDFDTHEDQVTRHGELMAALDRGLARFGEAVAAGGRTDRVLLMTTSEFGRRAADNDGGTDHGAASSQFLIGPAVQGGRHGEAPSLDRLDEDGNLVHTVDFRSVYASVLTDWFDAGAEDLLGRDYERLPLLDRSRISA
jgi:uncharacterized protein (DUF1501 family)